MDSNHRRHCQQIYSLSPLATRESTHMKNMTSQAFHKADDRTRTDNLLITNQLLCQLSHIGIYWMEKDSNLRRRCQQIYSLPPLATRESIQNFLSGAYRARTYDPLLVRQMLSQLS